MDFSAFTQKIPTSELKAYRARPDVKNDSGDRKLGAAIAIFILFFIVLPPVAVLTPQLSRLLGPAAGGVLGVGLFTLIMSGIFIGARYWIRWNEMYRLRLEKFAHGNNLRISFNASPPHSGVIFRSNGTATVQFHASRAGVGFELGNYEYTEGSGDSEKTIRWGYMAIPLNRTVPHMVLDAQANNFGVVGLRKSNLPEGFARDQVLQLEGDFNNYFTLYAPKEYEQDALRIFSPDLMALLIDNAAKVDVEVKNDVLYFYGKRFDLMNPTLWLRFMQIVDTIGQKAIKQTDGYADERVGSRALDLVAPTGSKLKSPNYFRAILSEFLVAAVGIILVGIVVSGVILITQ